MITAAVATAIPLRLRQILRVEAAAGADQENSTVVMVGGQRLPVGDLADGALSEVQDHEVGVDGKFSLEVPACVLSGQQHMAPRMRHTACADLLTCMHRALLLCLEVAALQQSGALPKLQVSDMACVAWRRQAGDKMRALIDKDTMVGALTHIKRPSQGRTASYI